MELSEAVARGLRGATVEVRREAPPLADQVAAIAGGRTVHASTELVRALGISERTWRRLRANPHGAYAMRTRTRLEAAWRAAAMPAPQRRLLAAEPHVVIDATFIVSSDRRQRTVMVSGWPTWQPTAVQEMLRHHLAGDDQAAADVLSAQIRRMVAGMYVTDVESVQFHATRADALRAMTGH